MKRRLIAAILIAISFALAGLDAGVARADGAGTNGVTWCKHCP